jgi:tRNA(Ile)-lysidine synthase
VRPFLKLRRQAVLHFLSANQFPYRVDSSNRDMQFTRNKLRLELLPILERDYNPAVVDVLCSLADQARDLDEAMVERALCLLRDAELPRAGNVIVLAQSRLQGAPVNDVREMFRALWQREGWPMGAMDFARWQRLAEIAAGTLAAFDFPGKIHVRRVGNVIQVRASAQSS